MGVDGIGSGGGRSVDGVPAAESGAMAGAVAEPARAAGAVAAPAASHVEGSTALAELERGEIDLDRYLDGRVADAVRAFEGRLPAAELDFVRKALREEIATDPVLVELVRRTTGSVPTPGVE